MIDLPYLRAHHPVILTSEFFELHGLDPSYESLAGDWNRGDFEVNVTFPPIHVIANSQYDPGNTIRVDTVKGLPSLTTIDIKLEKVLQSAIDYKKTLSWEDAVSALKSNGYSVDRDEDAERIFHSGGWVVTYSFAGV